MLPYSAFEKHIKCFKRFLCLAVQRPVYCTRVNGQTDEPKDLINGTPIFEDYLVLRKVKISEQGKENTTFRDFLFTLPELKPSADVIFKRFWQKQEQLQASMDLYFSTVYSSNHVARAEFLALAQSIEAYHRSSTPGKYMDDQAYQNGLCKTLWEAIPAEIDSDFRSSLKNKLRYLNEFSLKKRIKDLAKKHSITLPSLLGDADDFSKRVSELRNQLTHAVGTGIRAENDWRELFILSQKMSLLLEVCYLDEIGFTQDQIKAIASERNKHAQNIHYGVI